VDELPVADVRAKVRGINQEYYEVTATIDEEFGDVTNCNCGYTVSLMSDTENI
jgi:hypothetical protein